MPISLPGSGPSQQDQEKPPVLNTPDSGTPAPGAPAPEGTPAPASLNGPVTLPTRGRAGFFTAEENGIYLNLPSRVGGVDLTPDEALRAFREGRVQPAGIFDSEDDALSALKNLEKELNLVSGKPGDVPPQLVEDTTGDPEARLRMLQLSKKTGLPVNLVEADPKGAETFADLQRMSLDQIMEQYPKFSEFVNRPDRSYFAQKDIDPLTSLERELFMQDRTWSEFGSDTLLQLLEGTNLIGQGATGLVDMAWQSWARGVENPIRKALGQPTLDEKDLYSFSKAWNNLVKIPEFANRHYSNEYLRKLGQAESLPWDSRILYYLQNPDLLTGELVKMVPMMRFMMAFGTTSAIVAMGPEAFNAAISRGAVDAASRAATATVLRASALSEGGLSAGIMANQQLSQGTPYSHLVLPVIGTMVTTSLFPVLSAKLLPDVETQLALALAGQKTIGGAGTAGSVLKGVLSGAVKESALEEMPQSYFEQVWQNVAEGKPLTEDALGQAVVQGFLASFMGGFGSGAAQARMAFTAQANKDLINLKASETQQRTLDKIIEYARASKTREVDQAAFEEFAQSLHGPKEVFVAPEAFDGLDTSTLPEYITEQLDGSGKDVTIPMERFLSTIAVNEALVEHLRPHLRLEEKALSQADMKSPDNAKVVNLVEKARAEAERAGQLGELETQLVHDAMSTGRLSAREARASVKPLLMYIDRVSQEYKLSPKEVWEKLNTRFAGPDGVPVGPEPSPSAEGGTEAPPAPEAPKAVYTRNQDLGGVKITQETVDEKGRKVTLKADAQEVWDLAQEKLSAFEQLTDCLNG